MTTPKFTGYESVFDSLNTLILRGTDPSNVATYNARFTIFLNAINSSDEMRSAVAQFQASEGRFENNTSLDGSTFDERLMFDPNRNVINLSDDYFVKFTNNKKGMDNIADPIVQLGEEIRAVGHELSHALRSSAVDAQYKAVWNRLQEHGAGSHGAGSARGGVTRGGVRSCNV